MISKILNLLKIFLINLLIFIVILLIFESFFGYWFKEDNWGNQIRSWRLKKVEYQTNFNNREYNFTYKRNFYGFRGENFNPKDVEIVLIGGSTGNERLKPEKFTIVGQLNEYFKKNDLKYKIYNAAADGQSTIGLINNFKIWFPKIDNYNPKVYIIYLGVNERYYAHYDPNPKNFNYDNFIGEINDFDTLRKKRKIDRIIDYIKNNSIISYKIKEFQLSYFAIHKETISYDPNRFIAYYGTVQQDDLVFVNHKKASAIHDVNLLKDKYKIYVKSLTERLSYLTKIIKKTNSVPIYINQVMVNGQKSELMYITNEIIREYCIENNIYFIDLAKMAELELSDFYDDFHTTPEGSSKIANYISQKISLIFEEIFN